MTARNTALCMLGIVLMASACAPKRTALRKTPPPGTAGAAASGAAGSVGDQDRALADGLDAAGLDVPEAGIRGSEFARVDDLKSVRFEYDAYALDEAARTVLKANADYLRANPEMEVLVAGHCDERGTIQYNLALGQRRAKAVRDFYMRLGVRGRSVATISYGEEKPACADSTEECWAVNRRAETRVRARTVSNHHDTPKPR